MIANTSVTVLTDLTNFVQPGLETNEIRFATGQYLMKNEIKGMRILERTAARPRKIRVKPAIYAITTGVFEAGVKIIIEMDTTPQSVETYLNIDTQREFTVPVATATSPIAPIVVALVKLINEQDKFDNRTFPFASFKASVDPTDSTYILIEGNAPGLFNVFTPTDGALTDTVIVDPGYEGTLLDADVKREFPMFMDYVMGADLPREYQGGKTPVVITINGYKGPESASGYNAQGNLVQMGASGFKFSYQLWVNKADANYPAFLANLIAQLGVTPEYVTPIDLNLVAGTDLSAAVAGSNLTVSTPAGQLAGATMDYGTSAKLINAAGTSFSAPNAAPTTDGVFVLTGIPAGAYTAVVPVTYTLSGVTKIGTMKFSVTV